jgi:hypothetical protein
VAVADIEAAVVDIEAAVAEPKTVHMVPVRVDMQAALEVPPEQSWVGIWTPLMAQERQLGET